MPPTGGGGETERLRAMAQQKALQQQQQAGMVGAGQSPGGMTSGGKGGSTPGTTTSNVTPDMLSKFGYQGRMGVNPMEQMGLGLTAGMAGQQTPMQTTLPAQQALTSIAGGEFAPQGQKFRGDVYEATKAGAMENLADLQKQMGESFAHRGGYFGGRHALAQSKLAEQTANPLNQLLGQLNLQGFEGDIANRLTAAGGLTGLAGTQRGIESSLLGDVMGGGQMLTERELQNRQLYQGASDRAYQDWTRARQERMMPANLISSLLGAQTQMPAFQQPSQSGGLLGNLLGFGAGSILGPMGATIGSGLGGKVMGGK